jgi:hypothetical protein
MSDPDLVLGLLAGDIVYAVLTVVILWVGNAVAGLTTGPFIGTFATAMNVWLAIGALMTVATLVSIMGLFAN